MYSNWLEDVIRDVNLRAIDVITLTKLIRRLAPERIPLMFALSIAKGLKFAVEKNHD